MSKNSFVLTGLVLISPLLCVSTVLADMKGHAVHQHGSTIGEAGDAKKVTRTVKVGMSDAMRFTPSSIAVKKGETIRFVISNNGKLKHEFVIGKMSELQEHAEMMKKFPEMEHDEPNMASVAPGKTGEVIWHFTQQGVVDFACLQPGHFDAGMKGLVRVNGTGGKSSHNMESDHVKTESSKPMADIKADKSPGEMTEGEVRKLDKEAGTLTIRHEYIKSLDMQGMTMVFKAKDKAMIEKLQVGDKIKFNVIREDGKLIVTDIQMNN